MSGPKARLVITPAQAAYLHELVEYDLAETELTKDEKCQASALLRQISGALLEFKLRKKR